MVALLYACPHCGETKPVVRYGKNRSGTERLWCKACRKAWTPTPNNERRITAEKEARITAALSERLSQRAIARMLKVGRDTIRATRQKKSTNSR
jgi:transposase-like protein